VNRMLRDSVFAPIVKSTHSKALGVMCTFLVNAIAHELLVLQSIRRFTGHWFSFFILHGFLCLLEAQLENSQKSTKLDSLIGLRIRRFVGRVITWCVMFGSSHLLFVPPFYIIGFDAMAIDWFVHYPTKMLINVADY
jgi:hypothetical protein